MPRISYTYEKVRDYYESKGCKLLETEYKGVKSKHRFICGCGNEGINTFDSFKNQGVNRCKECTSKFRSKSALNKPKQYRKKRISYEEAKRTYEDAGCTLLENEFKGALYMHRFLCSCEEFTHENKYSHFKSGNTRCSRCSKEANKKGVIRTHEEIIKLIEDNLNKNYIFHKYERVPQGASKQLLVQVNITCDKGHNFNQKLYNIVKGHNCRSCSLSETGGMNRLKHEDVKNEIESLGLEMISIYKDSKTPITYICNCKDKTIVKQSLGVIRAGHRCGCRYKTGNEHHSWNPNLDEHVRMKKKEATWYYNDFRKSVYERDNYTCLKCSESGGMLRCHHIWAYHRYDKLQIETSNGITLCHRCHRDFHSVSNYGNKYFKPQDSYEYIPNLHKFTGYTYEEVKSLFINKGLLSPDSE